MPRIYSPQPFTSGLEIALDAAAARHVQVLRKQPGDALTLFNGQGGQYTAEITHMGRSDVRVRVGVHEGVERELACAVHIAVGVPANERMEWLVEKATELGVTSIQPLMLERSVLRLSGERAAKKVSHWQAIATAACEQSGRNCVPMVHAVCSLADWLAAMGQPLGAQSFVLSLQSAARPWQSLMAAARCPDSMYFLSGPEGGLSSAEEQLACTAGFVPLSLGPRVLRAETAPLVVLSSVAIWPSV